MREATIARKTTETDIRLSLALEGEAYRIDTGCGFLDHMLELFARHGGFGLELSCKGDTRVDYHHTVEDIGIALGEAVAKALGDKRGIARYGFFLLPMDEALILSAIDLSGRACLSYEITPTAEKVGSFDTELAEEFFQGFVRSAACTLHLCQLSGRNTHHILEGTFKAFARALRAAVSSDPAFSGEIPSTKGVL